MAPTDPHQGGSLSDMAVDGTSIPNDAGIQRIIPSVPRPDQKDPGFEFSHANPASAVDNATDIPRGVRDQGQTAEVVTGIGDQLPSSIEKKNMDDAGNDPRAKGHDRYMKHAKQKNAFGMVDDAAEDMPGQDRR